MCICMVTFGESKEIIHITLRSTLRVLTEEHEQEVGGFPSWDT